MYATQFVLHHHGASQRQAMMLVDDEIEFSTWWRYHVIAPEMALRAPLAACLVVRIPF